MKRMLAIAAKEALEGLRNKWAVTAALLLAALSLTLSLLGASPVGGVGASAMEVEIVSLSSLAILLLPLIALVVSHDAVVGEAERGTLALLLAAPVSRRAAILGKFAGHVSLLALATTLGFATAAIAIVLSGAPAGVAAWRAFAAMTGASVLLGASFVALGYCASVLAQDRATAGAIAIGFWLLFAVLFDLVLLGLLALDRGRSLNAASVNALLFLNPCDIYRLFTLGGASGRFSGMASVAAAAPQSAPALLAGLAAWIVIPLAVAIRLFERRDI